MDQGAPPEKRAGMNICEAMVEMVSDADRVAAKRLLAKRLRLAMGGHLRGGKS